jgi:hypothetical protein
MRKIIKWCSWEMKNEFMASGYFAAMLFMYCIIQWIYGEKQVDIVILIEMFAVNYVLSTLHKIFLDDEKDYSTNDFVIRATILSVVSLGAIIIASKIWGWFDGMPLWVGLSTYLILVISYIMVWILFKLRKKYDTEELNEQLSNYKKSVTNQ